MSDMPVDASTQHNEVTTDIARPVTTKPRGICKYYNTARGCYAGDRCKFLHGENERMSPFDKNKPCRFYAAGFCKRGDRCWFMHAQPGTSGQGAASQSDEDDENLCSICYDKPATYGLLVGCSHVFCITCIKNWRGSGGKSEDIIQAGTTKTCPMCRTASRFVIPSAFFYADQDPRKAQTIENYKASMARIKCKYFERSLLTKRRKCPFGNECFFKHENADGTPYVFEHGADHYMEQNQHSRRNAWLRSFFDMPDGWDEDLSVQVEGAALQEMLSSLVRWTNAHASRDALTSFVSRFDSVDSSGSEEDDDNGSEDGAAVNPPALASVAELASIEEVDDDEEAGASPDLWGDWPTVDGVHSLQDSVDDTGPDDLSSFQRSHAFVQSFPDSNLDPTTPEFVPSSQSRAVSSGSGPLYHQDGLRPLPLGPSSWLHTVDPHMHTSELEDGSSETTDPLSGRALPLTSSENPLRGSMDNEGRQCSGLVTASPLVSSVPSTASGSSTDQTSPSDTSLATPPSVPTTSPCSPMFAQEPDPPFRTDGRGRVVWSSATSPRSREGRRGRLSAAPVGYVAQPTVVPVSQFESGHGVDDESDMGTAL